MWTERDNMSNRKIYVKRSGMKRQVEGWGIISTDSNVYTVETLMSVSFTTIVTLLPLSQIGGSCVRVGSFRLRHTMPCTCICVCTFRVNTGVYTVSYTYTFTVHYATCVQIRVYVPYKHVYTTSCTYTHVCMVFVYIQHRTRARTFLYTSV